MHVPGILYGKITWLVYYLLFGYGIKKRFNNCSAHGSMQKTIFAS
jgi:hypothetical protein